MSLENNYYKYLQIYTDKLQGQNQIERENKWNIYSNLRHDHVLGKKYYKCNCNTNIPSQNYIQQNILSPVSQKSRKPVNTLWTNILIYHNDNRAYNIKKVVTQDERWYSFLL
jgi:hypothetical protein